MRHSLLMQWGIVTLTVVVCGCGAAGPPDMAMAPNKDQTSTAAEPPSLNSDEPNADEMFDTMALPDESADLDWSTEPPEMAMTAADEPPEFTATAGSEASSFAPTASSSNTGSGFSYAAGGAQPAIRSAPPLVPRSGSAISQVDEIVSRLEYGTVGFYTPSELPFGETFVQEVVLSPSESEAQLRSAMSNPTAPAEFVSLQVADRMEAKLTGRGFEIEPLSEPLQAITSHRPTKWRFNVTPIRHGRQQLHLTLLAHINVAGRDAPLTVETKDAVIDVDITVGQRLAGLVTTNWQWLWAAVFVPAIGFVWKRKTGRERRPVAPDWDSNVISPDRRIDSELDHQSSSTRPSRAQPARKASRAGTPGSPD
jgi:hypothetical protein